MARLLTAAAKSRRVREFGTLKALDWPTRRITGQVMGDAIATGLIGGVLGVALGYGGADLVSALAPALTRSARPPGRPARARCARPPQASRRPSNSMRRSP